MATQSNAVRLHQHLARMVALEAGIEAVLDAHLDELADHAEVAAVIQEIREGTRGHQQGLAARVQVVAPTVAVPDPPAYQLNGDGDYPASTALRAVYVVLNEAIIGYAMLRILALRLRDSPASGEEENTADLAEHNNRRAMVNIRLRLNIVSSFGPSYIESKSAGEIYSFQTMTGITSLLKPKHNQWIGLPRG